MRSNRDLATDNTVGGETEIGPSPSTGPRGGDESDLASGTTVGEYRIDDVLGRGGFGTVYRATQPLIGKRVAIKVLSHKYSADRDMVSRFTAEARAVNQIRHRHIIDIFSFGQLPDGRQYYVMEMLDGEPLDQYLASNGPLSLEQAMPILRAIARALDAAHAKGVAHRDLKPENVFLARDDDGALFPKLLDFGIAKLENPEEAHAHKTNTGVPIGTPYYMSPEQCRGAGVDYRTDIYSLGVVTYRLLTGSFPFEGNLVDIMHHHMYDEPPAPSSKIAALPKAVDDAVLWMLRKDPDQRPKTAMGAVVALQGQTPTPMITPTELRGIEITDRVPRSKRSRWLVPAFGAIVAAGAAVVIVMMTRGGGGETQQVVADKPAITVAPPPPPPPPQPETRTVAPPPPRSPHVTITVTGAPEGTEVSIGGRVVGSAPGPVQLDRSTEKMVLVFRADNYQSTSKEIVPDADKPLDVPMKRRAAVVRPTAPVRPQPVEDPDGIENPFKKGKP
jgi:serine/threonine-protein kinase